MTSRCVAITGAAGRIGRQVIAELMGRCELRGIDIAAAEDRIEHRIADVMDPQALGAALEGCEAIIHLAGHDMDAHVAESEFIRVNALGTFNVLEAAADRGIRRVIVCSSITATGLNEARPDHPPLSLPVDEDHPSAPLGAYGLSKQLAEQIAARFVRKGLEVVVLRPMLVMFPEYLPVVGERIAATGGRWLSYWVSPADTARALRMALEARNVTSGCFYVTARDTCREEPTLDWLGRALGRLPEIRHPEVYRRNPRASVLDGTRARDAFGFEAVDDWPAIKQRSSL